MLQTTLNACRAEIRRRFVLQNRRLIVLLSLVAGFLLVAWYFGVVFDDHAIVVSTVVV